MHFLAFQAARIQSEQAGNTCRQLPNGNSIHSLADQNPKETQTSVTPPSFIPGDREQSAPLMYTRQVSYPQNSGPSEEDSRKSAAAAVAAKLTASTSSAQMLSYVLSSLASEGVIDNSKESSSDYQSEKRTKLENDQTSYILFQNPQQQPLPPSSLPESLRHNTCTKNQQSTPDEQPPPPSSSPPALPPLPPIPQYPVAQFMQTTRSIASASYSYGLTQQQQLLPPAMAPNPIVGASLTGVSPFAPAAMSGYEGFQGSDWNYHNQPSSMPMAPVSRQ